jgi:hypothetical protein
MKIVCDIDGVICDEVNDDVTLRQPYPNRIAYLNSLFEQGHDIIIYTSRGMKSCNDNPIEADKKYRELTTKQLRSWGLHFDRLFFGKPNADIYLDNHNMSMDDFFEES